MKGYQRLEQNFFELCSTRKIKSNAMLLLIYLRGLYARFGENFYCKDSMVMGDLSMCKDTLRTAREKLEERGCLKYTPGNGKSSATKYTMIVSILLPEKAPPKVRKNHPFGTKKPPLSDEKVAPSIYTSNEESKQKEGFQPVDRENMRIDTARLIASLSI